MILFLVNECGPVLFLVCADITQMNRETDSYPRRRVTPYIMIHRYPTIGVTL